MKARTIVLSILMAMCLGVNAQAREPSAETTSSI